MNLADKLMLGFDKIGRSVVEDVERSGAKTTLDLLWRIYVCARVDKPFASQDEVQDLGALRLCCGQWVKHGRQAFELTPALATALAMTDCGDGIDNAMPFEAFVVKMPHSVVTVNDGKSVPLLLVSTTPVKEGEDALIRGVMIRAYSALDECLYQVRKFNSHEFEQEREPGGWILPQTDADLRVQEIVYRIVANLVRYIHEKIETPPVQPYRVKGPRGERKLFVRRRRFGSLVRLPAQMIQGCRDATISEPAYKVTARFMVRGHWRNQACGPGMKERKRIWVRPYWKGPTTGEQMRRLYKAETATESGMTH